MAAARLPPRLVLLVAGLALTTVAAVYLASHAHLATQTPHLPAPTLLAH
jgi:hypothetical protein